MAGWSKELVDMELDDESKLDACLPMPCETPDYPYGLRICLTHAELERLGLDHDCETGDMIRFEAVAVVTSVNLNESNGKHDCRIELQIQRMRCNDPDETEGDD